MPLGQVLNSPTSPPFPSWTAPARLTRPKSLPTVFLVSSLKLPGNGTSDADMISLIGSSKLLAYALSLEETEVTSIVTNHIFVLQGKTGGSGIVQFKRTPSVNLSQ
jgi:hypothetical protein